MKVWIEFEDSGRVYRVGILTVLKTMGLPQTEADVKAAVFRLMAANKTESVDE